MRLKFAKLNPNGNITLLVLDPVARSRQAAIAEALMGNAGVQAEQVGFLEDSALPDAQARLQMMGGEFCGNATLSLAAYLAWRDGAEIGEERRCRLEVSGAAAAMECRIRAVRDGVFAGEVPMPLPEAMGEVELFENLTVPLVRFSGIAHAILPEGAMEDERAMGCIAELCARLKTDALGFLFVSENFQRIRPLVYVQNTDTAIWENGCGSGTAALGAWCAAKRGGEAHLAVEQPGAGKVIGVHADFGNGKIRSLSISGGVEMVAIGEAWAPEAGTC